jgi:hypothetical protein
MVHLDDGGRNRYDLEGKRLDPVTLHSFFKPV